MGFGPDVVGTAAGARNGERPWRAKRGMTQAALAKSAATPLLPLPSDKQRLQVGPIQPRLQLPRCEDVKAGIAPGLRDRSRVLVELRCDGRTAWHLFVPVRIVGTSPVAVAVHAIVAGTVLTAKDVSVEQRDLTGLPPGYLNDPTIAVGLTASRGISSCCSGLICVS